MTKTRVDDLERYVDLIHSLGDVNDALAESVKLLRGMAVNDVLATQTEVFDADGIIALDWSVPFASVAVGNTAGGAVTVAAGGAARTAPTSGPGVAVVPAGASATINLTGRELTFYGPVGGRISFSVFAKPQGPAFAGGSGDTTAGVPTQAADVAVTAAGVVVLAANAARKAAVVQNTGAAPIRVGFTGQVAANRGIQLTPGGTFRVERPYVPTMEISAFRDAGAGADSTATGLEIT